MRPVAIALSKSAVRPFAIAFPVAAVVLAALLACGTGSAGGGGSDFPGQSASHPAWRVRDTGLRCVTFPCFSLEGVPVAGGAPESLSDVDLDALGLTPAVRDSVLAELHAGGVTVRGVVEAVPDAGPAGTGRVLRVSRLVSGD